MNIHSKNYFITMYEYFENNDNETLKEFKKSFEKYKNNIKVYTEYKIETYLFFISIVFFLLMLLIFPLWFSNAFNFSKKSVVLDIDNNNLIKKSYNLGTLRGYLYINSDKYDKNLFYKYGYVYYKGPFVISNKIPVQFIQTDIIDSIVSFIYPPEYQKKAIYKLFGKNIYANEFSDINIKIFTSYDTIIEYKYKAINNKNDSNNIITLFVFRDTIKLNVNIIKDKYPVCEFISDSFLNMTNMTIIDIPFIAIDDYQIKNTGVILKTSEDSINMYLPVNNDSIFILRINIDSIKTQGEIHIIAYAQDNNPYRKQISYSRPIILKRNTENMQYQIKYDNDINERFEKHTDNLIYRFNKIKSSIVENNRNKTIEQLKKGIEELKQFNKDLKQELSNINKQQLDEKILQKMYEIKQQIKQLDESIIQKIIQNIDNKKIENISQNDFNEFIKNNTDKIIKSLDNLKELIKQLKQMQELDKLDKALEQLIKEQDKIMNLSDEQYKENQSNITKKIEQLAEETDIDILPEIKNELQSMKQQSQKAETDKQMAEKLKQKMQKLQERIKQMLNNTATGQINIGEIIRSLYLLNFTINEKFSRELCENVYKDIYNSIVNIDNKNPILSILANGIKLTKREGISSYDIIEYNFYIISMLLRKQENQMSSSMQQAMQQLQSLSKTEQAISQMLWEMYNKGVNSEQMNAIAQKQSEIAEKLKQLSKMDKSGKILGNMQSIADSLKDISEQLKKGILNKDIIEKEKRILNRLLNLNKSVYRKGISEQRESKTGKEYNDKINIILPEDLGYDVNNIKKKVFEFLKDYKNNEYKPLLRMYYMEILK